jgi:cytochrome P450
VLTIQLVVSILVWWCYLSYHQTASATGAFLHLVAKHPEVQIKAQEEIDRVIGDNRLPDFSDRPHLPYIEAIYREVLRWHPPMTLAPHASMDDDVYKGYFIPKGEFPFLRH